MPTHVRTPDGREPDIRSDDLLREICGRYGSGLELMQHRHGLFDDATISVISTATIAGIGAEAEMELDRRRFRAKIVLEANDGEPFLENDWIGRTLVFGDDEPAPAVHVTAHDVRCMMINLDPDTAAQDARVLKTVVRLNAKNAAVPGAAGPAAAVAGRRQQAVAGA